MRIINKIYIGWTLWFSSGWIGNILSRATGGEECDMSNAEVEIVLLEDTSMARNKPFLHADSIAFPKIIEDLPVKSVDVAVSVVGSKPADSEFSSCFSDVLPMTTYSKPISDENRKSLVHNFKFLEVASTFSKMSTDYASAISHVLMGDHYFSSKPHTIKILMINAIFDPIYNETHDMDMNIFKGRHIPHCVPIADFLDPVMYPSDANMRTLFRSSNVITILTLDPEYDGWIHPLENWGIPNPSVNSFGAYDLYDKYMNTLKKRICEKISETKPTTKPPISHTPTASISANTTTMTTKKRIPVVVVGVIAACCTGAVALIGGLAYWGIKEWRERH